MTPANKEQRYAEEGEAERHVNGGLDRVRVRDDVKNAVGQDAYRETCGKDR
jgi:hypothetical protein